MKKTERQLKAVAKQLQALTLKIERLAGVAAAEKPVKAKPKAKAKRAAKKAAPKKTPASASTVLDTVYGVIRKSKKGAAIAAIKKKTGLETRQLSNALYKLTKKGVIKTQSRGVYIKS